VVVRYLIPHARRITDAPLDVVPQISWGNSVLTSAYRGLCSGALKGRSAEPILLGCPLLLQLWCHKRFAIGRPVVPLYAYEPLPEGHDPRVRFTMGSFWCLRKVISYLSLSNCPSISSSLFNQHLGFTFGLYADLVRPRPDEEGVQGTSSSSSTLSRMRTSGGRPTQRRLSRPAHHRGSRLCASETTNTG
jgi:hypothetical protein